MKIFKSIIESILWLVIGLGLVYFVSSSLWIEIQDSKNSYYASICGLGLLVSVLPFGYALVCVLTTYENIKRTIKRVRT